MLLQRISLQQVPNVSFWGSVDIVEMWPGLQNCRPLPSLAKCRLVGAPVGNRMMWVHATSKDAPLKKRGSCGTWDGQFPEFLLVKSKRIKIGFVSFCSSLWTTGDLLVPSWMFSFSSNHGSGTWPILVTKLIFQGLVSYVHDYGRSNCLGGGFKHFDFHPYLGRWSNLTNIHQMGCNRQLVVIVIIWLVWWFVLVANAFWFRSDFDMKGITDYGFQTTNNVTRYHLLVKKKVT